MMLCTILKKPDETPDADVEIAFRGEPVAGLQEAIIKRPKGRARTSLRRLSTFSWTRNHSYGYVRLKSGALYKIDSIDGGTVGSPATVVYLMPASERFKIKAYCKCGGAMAGTVGTKDRTSVEKCVQVFWSAHDKAGCGPTDAKTAARARRKGEAEAASE